MGPLLPPDALPLFEEAAREVGETGVGHLALVPIPEEGALWVDGRPQTLIGGDVELRAGRHIIQIGSPKVITTQLVVDADELTTLILPATVPLSAASWANDPERRDELSTVLDAALTVGSTIYVSVEGQVWRTKVGSGEWEELRVPTGFFAMGGGAPRGRFYAGHVLFWTGAASMVGGGAFATVSYLKVGTYSRDGERAEDFETYDAAKELYQQANARFRIGLAITAGGAALTGVGLGLNLNNRIRAVPTSLGGSAGLSIHWTLGGRKK
jgi:hypothetical protein